MKLETYDVEMLGAEADEPPSYYRVTAYDEVTAMLVASLIDQHTPHRPISRQSPITIDLSAETEIAKSYAHAKRLTEVYPTDE